MVCAPQGVVILAHHCAAAHRGAGAGMRDRYERFVGIADEGWSSVNVADPMDQPVPVYFQNCRDLCELLDPWPGRATTQDVVDEGAIDPGHLGNVGGAEAKLVGAGAETVGKGMLLGHVFPRRLWI